METWIEEELSASDFGDARLDQRYVEVMNRLSQKPSAIIPTACETWKETRGAYRFFDNEAGRRTRETPASPRCYDSSNGRSGCGVVDPGYNGNRSHASRGADGGGWPTQ